MPVVLLSSVSGLTKKAVWNSVCGTDVPVSPRMVTQKVLGLQIPASCLGVSPLGEDRDCHPGLAPCLWFRVPVAPTFAFCPTWIHKVWSTWQSSPTDYKEVFWGDVFFPKCQFFLSTINLRKGTASRTLPGGVQGADVTSVLWGLLGITVTHLLTCSSPWFYSMFHRSTVHLATLPGLHFTYTVYSISVLVVTSYAPNCFHPVPRSVKLWWPLARWF